MMLLYFEKRTMFTTQSCTRLKSRKLSWRGKGPLVRLHCLHSTYSVQLSKYLWYPVEKHQNSPKSSTLHDPHLSWSFQAKVLTYSTGVTPVCHIVFLFCHCRKGSHRQLLQHPSISRLEMVSEVWGTVLAPIGFLGRFVPNRFPFLSVESRHTLLVVVKAIIVGGV